MPFPSRTVKWAALVCTLIPVAFAGCKATGEDSPGGESQPSFVNSVASAPSQGADDALPPEKTGGFDGKRAYALVAKQVNFGPRPSGSPAIVKLQNFLESELKGYGCSVETDNFSADTPAGRISMKNLLVKIPGEKPGVILLGTHYDTKRLQNFVGADDGGSSTAVMLELARLLCKQRGRYAVWIAFFDGEEAVNLEWRDPDNRYGSRQMAAKLAASGDLPKIKAFLLADIVGGRNFHAKKESYSTQWLESLVWKTAAGLGYQEMFPNQETPVEDDHLSFLSRNVPSADVIDLENSASYWHTPQDTLDKISAKTLAVVGHVFLESVKELQSR